MTPLAVPKTLTTDSLRICNRRGAFGRNCFALKGDLNQTLKPRRDAAVPTSHRETMHAQNHMNQDTTAPRQAIGKGRPLLSTPGGQSASLLP